MLGTVRFALAALVVLNHLWLPTANKVGAHAVAAFFVVSGYLMTKVIQQTYGPSPEGAFRFLVNRALRIFPIYWVCLSATLLLLVLFGDAFRIYSTINLPDAGELLRNITLFELPSSTSILVPPAWSLTVEFAFYLMMVMVLARSKSISTVWFVASLAFTVYLVWTGASFGDRYSRVSAGSMFFSAGSMLYWYRLPAPPRRLLWPLLAIFCISPIVCEMVGIDRLLAGYYGAALLFVPIFLIANTRPEGLDRRLGDLAYPLFVVHYLCAGIVRLVAPGVQPLGVTFLVLSFLLSLGCSIGLVWLQREVVDGARDRLRPGRKMVAFPRATNAGLAP
jgi:peptidoglycan/LPS O-acetylase OafA/YrhL